MAFGRLDVYWPDGPIEIYRLDKPTVGIGRQRGNDIVLDTNTVSRYHASLMVEGDQCHIRDLDSVNGTYVDGVRLKPQEPYRLRGGEEIQVGDVRLVFNPAHAIADTAPTPLTSTETLALALPTFEVTVEGAEQYVTPGVHARAELLVRNNSDKADHYFIELDGVSKDWVHLDRVEMALDPGAEGHVVIGFKPPRRPESAIGDYAVTLNVRAQSQPAQPLVARLTLHVLSFAAFGMRLDPGGDAVQPGQPFTVRLHNQGNIALPISLHGRDSQRAGLLFHFQPQQMTLQPGQQIGVLATVQVSRALRGNDATLPFAVVAASHDAAAWQVAVPGRLHIPAARSTLKWLGAGGAVLALIVVAVALALWLAQPSSPEIVSDLALASPVAGSALLAGDLVTLSWQVRNAEQLQLVVNLNGNLSAQVDLPLDAQETTYLVGESGQYTFNVLARKGDIEVAGAPVTVQVWPKIVRFEANPRVLVRGVAQALTLSWETQGATGVRITGLEGLLGQPDDNIHPPNGSNTYTDFFPPAEGNASLHLVALAGGGVPEQQSAPLDVAVVPAECTVVAAEGAPLYDQEGRPPLTMLADNERVIAQAADPARQWVRVITQTNLVGWVAWNALFCGNFDPALLVAESIVPTPMFTLTPTATMTPSLTPTATFTASPTPTRTPGIIPTFTPSPTKATPRP